jgi:hypothetical protein
MPAYTEIAYNWEKDTFTLEKVNVTSTLHADAAIFHTDADCTLRIGQYVRRVPVGQVFLADGHFYAKTGAILNAIDAAA